MISTKQRTIVLRFIAIAAVFVLFAAAPLVTTHQAQAYWGRGWGWHHGGWHHGGWHHGGWHHGGWRQEQLIIEDWNNVYSIPFFIYESQCRTTELCYSREWRFWLYSS